MVRSEIRRTKLKVKGKMEVRSLCLFILFAGLVSGQDGFRLYMTKVYIKNACNKVRIREKDALLLPFYTLPQESVMKLLSLGGISIKRDTLKGGRVVCVKFFAC